MFKIGDKVKVVKKVETAPGWDDHWVEDMDEFIGRIGVIDILIFGGFGVIFAHNVKWNFPQDSLELVEE